MPRGLRSLAFSLACVLGAGCELAQSGVTNPMSIPDRDAAEQADGAIVVMPRDGAPDTARLDGRDGGAPPDTAPRDTLPPPDLGPPPPAGWVGPPVVVAVGPGGRRVVSRDGITWTGDTQEAVGAADPTKNLTAVAYAAGTLVAVGGGCKGATCVGRCVTFNGDKWAEAVLPTGQSWLGGVAFGNNLWVAAGAAGPIVTSPDGKTWTQKGNAPTQVRAVAYGAVGGTDMFVAVGDNGLRMRSLDGQVWTNQVQGFPGADDPVALLSVAIGEGVAVAAGDGGRRIRVANGIDWTDPAAGGTIALFSVVHGDRAFFAYSDTIVYVSSDSGRTWMPQVGVNPPGNSVTAGLLNGARIFVAARGGVIKTSTNGVAWIDRLSAPGNTFSAFGFGGY
jgi:hypothetical protein